MREKIETIVDRILYSDLPELGYNVEKLEPEREGLIEYITKMAKGKQGTAQRRGPKSVGKLHTYTQAEVQEYKVRKFKKELASLTPSEKAEVMQEFLK